MDGTHNTLNQKLFFRKLRSAIKIVGNVNTFLIIFDSVMKKNQELSLLDKRVILSQVRFEKHRI